MKVMYSYCQTSSCAKRGLEKIKLNQLGRPKSERQKSWQYVGEACSFMYIYSGLLQNLFNHRTLIALGSQSQQREPISASATSDCSFKLKKEKRRERMGKT